MDPNELAAQKFMQEQKQKVEKLLKQHIRFPKYKEDYQVYVCTDKNRDVKCEQQYVESEKFRYALNKAADDHAMNNVLNKFIQSHLLELSHEECEIPGEYSTGFGNASENQGELLSGIEAVSEYQRELSSTIEAISKNQGELSPIIEAVRENQGIVSSRVGSGNAKQGMKLLVYDRGNFVNMNYLSGIEVLNIPAVAVLTERRDILQLCIKSEFDLKLLACGSFMRSLLELTAMITTECADILEDLIKHLGVTSLEFELVENVIFNRGIMDTDAIRLLRLLYVQNKDIYKTFNMVASSLSKCLGRDPTNENYAKEVINILAETENLNTRNIWGKSPIMETVMQEYNISQELFYNIMNYLIEKGSDLSTTDHAGDSLIHAATHASNLDIELMEYLISKGCPVDIRSNIGDNAIYHICYYSSAWGHDHIKETTLPIVKVLLEANGDINAPLIDGSTLLHLCCARFKSYLCEYMIDNGALISVKDYVGRQPIHYAAYNGNVEVFDTMLQACADINTIDIYQHTPLHYSCLYGNTAAVKLLIANNADIYASAYNNIQPLHLASENGDPEMIHSLLEAGANVNCIDKYGATPLHYAAYDAYPENVETLLLTGADIKALDDFNQTALDLALKNGKIKNAELLSRGNPVKYGDLSLFPNRPSIDENELEPYFKQVQLNFDEIGNSEKIIKSLLKTNGLSRVKFEDGENQEIKIYVENFVQSIAKRIGELDCKFKGTVINSGSVYEGVKIGYPDEFDYMIKLDKFSDIVADFGKMDAKGFVKLSAKYDGFEKYIFENKYLNASKIFKVFRRLLYIAIVDVLKRFPRLQGGYTLYCQYKDVFSEGFISQAVLTDYSISWRGGSQKILDISLDINPVLYTENISWPESVIKSSCIAGNLQSKGLYVIPKALTQLIPSPLTSNALAANGSFYKDNDAWRISFSHIENEMFNTIYQSLRDAFCVIKLLKKEPISPAVIQKPVVPLFDNMDETDDDDSEIEEDEGDQDEEKEANTDTDDEYGNNGIHDTDEGDEDEDKEEVEDEDETPDITADKCIPTYTLKQLFFQEVDQMYKSGKLVHGVDPKQDQEVIKNIVFKVYTNLLAGIDKGFVSSYFIPGHNIYSKGCNSYKNAVQAEEVKYKLIKGIVGVLKTAGFDK